MFPKLLSYIAFLILVYVLIVGLIGNVPARPILNETIRNLYFHVPMWFSMFGLLSIGLANSIKYLASGNPVNDLKAESYITVGVVVGVLGLLTGMIWAKYTWGAWWVSDPKLNGSAITLLMYAAYFVLRSSLPNQILKAKLSNVYSIIAYVMWIVFLIILPRITDSLHPGNGGNPGFSNYDLDSNMKMVFYPAVIGWFLLTVWISTITFRIKKLAL